MEILKKGLEDEQSIQHFIREFLGSFLATTTQKAYLKDLETFFNFLKEMGLTINHPTQIRSHHFQTYRDFMLESELSSSTINRRLVSIRSFIKWAIAVKLMDHNPLDAIKLPKAQTTNPTLAFTDEEVQTMIESPNINSRTGNTHRMILVLLFHLGLRRSELTQIRLEDIYQDRGHVVLRIKGKGGKERFLPLPQVIQDEIKHYQDRFSSFTGLSLKAKDYLIQSRPKGLNQKPCDGSTIFRIVRRYAEHSGILKRVGPHSCRATVISHLLDTQRTPLRDVAHFAGHSSPLTTERYDKKRKGLDDNPVYQVNFNGKQITPPNE